MRRNDAKAVVKYTVKIALRRNGEAAAPPKEDPVTAHPLPENCLKAAAEKGDQTSVSGVSCQRGKPAGYIDPLLQLIVEQQALMRINWLILVCGTARAECYQFPGFFPQKNSDITGKPIVVSGRNDRKSR